MYKIILVPLDGSQRAEAILPHVEQLARLYQAEVVLLQVFELPHYVNLARVEASDAAEFDAISQINIEEMQTKVRQAQAYLAERAKALSGQGIVTRRRVDYGPVPATIIRVAGEEGADLIAMASHGCGGLQGVYYGSVAAGVLQRVDRPLLIVRAQTE